MAVPAPDKSLLRSEAPIEAETRRFGVSQSDASAIDEWIENVGHQWEMSARTIFGARLCIAELVNNVIEHGRARHDDDHLVLTLSRYNGAFGLEFMDTTGPFDPTNPVARAQDLTESIGGRGLMLIHAYARELGYRHDGRYNRTTLKIAFA